MIISSFVQVTFGWIAIVPPSGSAAATALNSLTYLIGGAGSFSTVNNTVLKVQGTLPLLNTAVTYLMFLPWTNYHGLETKIVLTLDDDGAYFV